MVDFSVLDVCLGDVVNFTNLSSGVSIASSWDFGDGVGVSVDQNPLYTYLGAGVYDVSLSVVSGVGCEASAVQDVVIHELPVANLSVNAYDVCLGDVVNFTNLSSGSSITSSWDFGDGVGVSVDQNPLYTYLGSECHRNQSNTGLGGPAGSLPPS